MPTVRKREYRILHGLTGAAGQARALSLGLRRRGIAADCVILGKSKMGYEADFHIVQDGREFENISAFLKERADDYDIFHLHFRPFFRINPKDLRFPTFADIFALKAAGKRVIFHYRGSEARISSEFKLKSAFNYVDENPNRLIENFPDKTKSQYIAVTDALCDQILANDAEIASYLPQSQIINRVVDEEKIEYEPRLPASRPLVIHAPSRRAVKGTDNILAAVEQLKSEGLEFDFKLVEGLDHASALKLYHDADIIVDQLRIGWYGVLAVEGMALGKAVMAYIRDDLRANLPDASPICMTSPLSIADDLRRLIINQDLRADYSRRSRKWFEKEHSEDAVISKLIEIYDDVIDNPCPANLKGMLCFIEFQAKVIEETFSNIHGRSWTAHNDTNDAWYPEKLYSKIAFLMETQGIRGALTRVMSKFIPAGDKQ